MSSISDLYGSFFGQNTGKTYSVGSNSNVRDAYGTPEKTTGAKNNTDKLPARPEIKENAASSVADDGKVKVSGKTIGNVSLSKKAADYYEKLKDKFKDMDFVLVSADQKKNAAANAASYGNPYKQVVLIDEEKLEKMAADENFAKKYESIIANSSASMKQFSADLQASGLSGLVKGFGMSVDKNGNTSFFAALEKSGAAQKERIEKKAAAAKAAKKTAEKRAAKKAEEERLEEIRSKGKDKVSDAKHAHKAVKDTDDEDKLGVEPIPDLPEKKIDWEKMVTFKAGTSEELLRMIEDYSFSFTSGNVRTASELAHGQNVDFSA